MYSQTSGYAEIIKIYRLNVKLKENKMKKSIIVFLALTVLAGCAKKTPPAPVAETSPNVTSSLSESGTGTTEITPDSLAKKVLSKVPLSGEAASQNDISDIGFKEGTVKDFSYTVCGTGAYPDKLLIVEFNTSDDAKAGKVVVDELLQQDKDNWKDYAPKEMYKLDDAFVTVKDNWLFYGVTADNVTAEEILSIKN
jgi:hypothetical protein